MNYFVVGEIFLCFQFKTSSKAVSSFFLLSCKNIMLVSVEPLCHINITKVVIQQMHALFLKTDST